VITSEENLLEQTLGQTLTQQKDILDQINKETQNRNHMQLMNGMASANSTLSFQNGHACHSSMQQSVLSKATASALTLGHLAKELGVDLPYGHESMASPAPHSGHTPQSQIPSQRRQPLQVGS